MAVIQRLSWLPRLDRGCWCCPLETFCLVFGYFSVVTSLVVMVVMLVAISIGTPYDWGFLIVARVILAMTFEGFICFVLSVICIMGVHQRRQSNLMPFVIFLHLRAVVAIHLAIWVGTEVPVVTLPGTLPLVGFIIYPLLCVNSLRIKFAEEDLERACMSVPSAPGKNNIDHNLDNNRAHCV
ncbi:uncharacterized protein LOC117652425 [Thrips palmi]|uniref:Uncharacterized protein LOC117652425 n=1 Tax=Thrips palmi TaxID=161013 RepID=A0A6P9A6R8_THRPL|nr:uncharacterized protein LOC117652425 [Thrips palmi]